MFKKTENGCARYNNFVTFRLDGSGERRRKKKWIDPSYRMIVEHIIRVFFWLLLLPKEHIRIWSFHMFDMLAKNIFRLRCP